MAFCSSVGLVLIGAAKIVPSHIMDGQIKLNSDTQTSFFNDLSFPDLVLS